ncbi:competence type IV pilus major pilin ComGC [Gracilibacillus alcaliphilus]|uniref:competence type IV pilus major pilin ComGC n=1 Tax=Gracilibacillus alcaliphilus TaxID=1401441 RepID=UPI00195E83FA|nr:competence type IV pilus major pilin ComGC [Gracilibacillus alcaliphilus]MBM7675038.1 competence protein ComGC [Gracilibacillus alcaliphilus]
MRNEKGFTLIEMLIVLAVISILLILFIPNLANKSDNINTKGCEALLQMAENQVLAYEIDQGKKPTNLDELVREGYLETTECSNGSKYIGFDNNQLKILSR